MNLPTIPGANLNKVYDFYEGLVASVWASETVEKLADFKEYTRMTLEKLPKVWPDFVQLNGSWKNWNLLDLVDALRKWTNRNPPVTNQSKSLNSTICPEKLLHANSGYAFIVILLNMKQQTAKRYPPVINEGKSFQKCVFASIVLVQNTELLIVQAKLIAATVDKKHHTLIWEKKMLPS